MEKRARDAKEEMEKQPRRKVDDMDQPQHMTVEEAERRLVKYMRRDFSSDPRPEILVVDDVIRGIGYWTVKYTDADYEAKVINRETTLESDDQHRTESTVDIIQIREVEKATDMRKMWQAAILYPVNWQSLSSRDERPFLDALFVRFPDSPDASQKTMAIHDESRGMWYYTISCTIKESKRMFEFMTP